MKTRARFRRGAGSLGSLLLLAACSSGQTGSPVSRDPVPVQPPYETPGRRDPERPGGGTGEGGNGGAGRPNAVPRPPPRPGSTALLGDTLVVADRGEVAFLDVSVASAPVVVGRAELGSEPGEVSWRPISAGLLRADALDQLVVSVTLEPHASDALLPSAPVPRTVQELWLVDGSTPAAPRIISRAPVPADALEVAVHANGYTALGARVSQQSDTQFGNGCGAGGLELVGELDFVPPVPEVVGLWLERFDAQGGAVRRELAAGHWQLSSDQSHAIRIGLPAHAAPTGNFELELVALSSLQTVFSTTITPTDLGAPLSSALGADFADGVLVVAGGSRLLGFDVASGAALPPLLAPGRIENPRFIGGGELVLEGGGAALARLDTSAATPALSLVPVAQGTPLGGPLLRFGSGYLALEGSSDPVPLLRATSYALDETGSLVLIDQLQTSWYFHADYYGVRPWHVDVARERLSYARPGDDGAGVTSVILGNQGELTASASLPTRAVAPALLHGDVLLGFAGGTLQPLRLDGSSTPALTVFPSRTVALADVWLEVQHGGWLWARHRTDTGESSLSVRASEHAEPLRVELPHAVDYIVPVGPSHVAVFGFSVSGSCDTWRELGTDFELECGPNAGNGVSVIAMDGGTPRVARSLPLTSFLEGRPPAGIEQSIEWLGYLELGPGQWALWGDMQRRCSSEESCAALGVPAYESFGVSGCSSGQTCSSEVQRFVSGHYNESWLFPLDLSDPEAPVLHGAVRAGARLRAGGELGADLGPQLLGYDAASGRVWGYAVDEPVYGADGNSVFDAAGHALHRWYLQLVEERNAEPSFGVRVSVPGQAVMVSPGNLAGGSAEHTAFTLEPRFDAEDRQSLWLARLRLTGDEASVDDSLELAPTTLDARSAGDWLAVLSGPADYCVEDAQYELRALDTRSPTLQLSAPLVLPGLGSGWSFSATQGAGGKVELQGGPARGAGVLNVDLTSDPPRVLGYDY